MGSETKRLLHNIEVDTALSAASYGAAKAAKLIESAPLPVYQGTNILRAQPWRWGIMRSLARVGKGLHFGVRGIPLLGIAIDLLTPSEIADDAYEKRDLRKWRERNQAVTSPYQVPEIVTRSRPSRPKPIQFPPEIVTHSTAFKKYGFAMPTGRRDVFPRERLRVPMNVRQDWLRDYYRANPMATTRARSEARRVTDWAHQQLREPFRVPTGRRDVFPPERLNVPMNQRQGWLRDYYRANPMAAAQARSEARTIVNWANTMLRR